MQMPSLGFQMYLNQSLNTTSLKNKMLQILESQFYKMILFFKVVGIFLRKEKEGGKLTLRSDLNNELGARIRILTYVSTIATLGTTCISAFTLDFRAY